MSFSSPMLPESFSQVCRDRHRADLARLGLSKGNDVALESIRSQVLGLGPPRSGGKANQHHKLGIQVLAPVSDRVQQLSYLLRALTL